MKVTYFFLIATLFAANTILAQKDSIVHLDEIVLPITRLKNFSKGYYTKVLKDSVISKNNRSLTDVLRYHSFLYFKENGNGMVSSPSFRGTNASQTAVVWNGININSQLNGQTDFNTIPINSLNSIAIRSGGGSVLYGSGAIGGTVHLHNNILFFNTHQKEMEVAYGSFATVQAIFTGTLATTKKYMNTTLTYNTSDNNYRYLGTDLTNENGEYTNYSISGNFGYKFNAKNQLKYYGTTFFGDRNFSRTLTAPSKTNYKDFTTKNLLEWNHLFNSTEVFTVKTAFLTEKYSFFEDKSNPNLFSEGQSARIIGLVDYKKKISSKININTIFSYENAIGKGDNLQKKSRNTFAGVFLLNHKLSKMFSYGVQVRKEYVTNYNAPLVYSLGMDILLIKNYKLSLNTSKNFRIPTFNDLYWQFGGNPDLHPETSYQYEMGNQIKIKNTVFQLNGFSINSQELIQWKPDVSGNWTPINVAKTSTKGVEVSINTVKKIMHHHQLQLAVNYSYTVAKNLATQQTLRYVPKHKATINLGYQYKNVTAYYQQLMNGNVYVIGNELPAYTVSNIGINYQLKQQYFHPNIGLKMNNIFNTNYQNVLNRPMPTRNIHITLKFKF